MRHDFEGDRKVGLLISFDSHLSEKRVKRVHATHPQY